MSRPSRLVTGQLQGIDKSCTMDADGIPHRQAAAAGGASTVTEAGMVSLDAEAPFRNLAAGTVLGCATVLGSLGRGRRPVEAREPRRRGPAGLGRQLDLPPLDHAPAAAPVQTHCRASRPSATGQPTRRCRDQGHQPESESTPGPPLPLARSPVDSEPRRIEDGPEGTAKSGLHRSPQQG